MTDETLFLIKLALATMIVPTVTYFSVRQLRPGPRPLAARIAAWTCMWVGQVAGAMGFVVVVCMAFAHEWWADDARLAAIVYGAGMAVVAVFLLVLALRVFALGPLALGQATEDEIAARARALTWRALIGLGVSIGYFLLMVYGLPIPGWLTPVVYLALVIVPVTLASLLVLLMALVLRNPPWRAPTFP